MPALHSSKSIDGKNQDHYAEVWIEKDALVGVIEGVCEELDVPFFCVPGLHQPE